MSIPPLSFSFADASKTSSGYSAVDGRQTVHFAPQFGGTQSTAQKAVTAAIIIAGLWFLFGRK